MLIFALITLAFYVGFIIDMMVGGRHFVRLPDAPVWPDAAVAPGQVPRVSVIIPARNEERNLAEALASVRAQDYPNLEIILLNDRSSDRTGAIMRELAANDERLRVIDIVELPPGWLGKNWALALGTSRASGELLLFADADVLMHPTAIGRAVGHLRRVGADHLAIGPSIISPPGPIRVLLAGFSVFFSFYATPWRVHRKRSKAFIGIGAFNLITRNAYDKVGTHQAIAMRPDDDMKLGKLVKRAGLQQEFMPGHEMLRVEWYTSLREMIDGLMKNAFAGVDYSLVRVASGIAAMLATMLWPFAALVCTHGLLLLINALIVLVLFFIYACIAPRSGFRLWLFLAFPVAAVLMMYVVLRSTILTYKQGGIVWRGTLYPLAQLKANKV